MVSFGSDRDVVEKRYMPMDSVSRLDTFFLQNYHSDNELYYS